MCQFKAKNDNGSIKYLFYRGPERASFSNYMLKSQRPRSQIKHGGYPINEVRLTFETWKTKSTVKRDHHTY